MSLATLMVDDVVILRASTTTDRYQNTIRDFAAATSTASKAWVAQRTAEEVVSAGNTSQGRTGELSDWICYLPAGTDVVAGDRVVWEGDTFEVIGKPNPAHTPRGAHHLELSLRLVVG